MSRRRRQPAPAAVAPLSSPPGPGAVVAFAIAQPAFWLLALVALAYLWLAWVTSGQDTWWLLGIVDGQNLMAIDDAYRYWLSRGAWQDADRYAWNFVLPGTLLLDGALATLAGGDLFLMRAAHALAGVAALWLTWLTGVRLGAGRAAMTVSVLVLALMPLYAFTFLSFYGENWLALGVSVAAFLLVSGRERSAALAFAALPLLRPEGLFLIVPLGLFWLWRRRWPLLLLLGGPGFLYGLYLLAVLDSPADYLRWRTELLGMLQQVPQPAMRDPLRLLSTFNPAWLLPALAGLVAPALRRWWPLWGGAVAWLAYNLASVAQGLSFYEARYFLSLLPLLAIGWPFAFAWLAARWPGRGARAAGLALLCAVGLGVTAEHLLQVDPWKAGYGDRRWPVAGPPAQQAWFGTLSPRAQAGRRDMAVAIERIVAGNPAIDRVIVNSVELFYYLDPALSSRVRVLYAPGNDAVARATAGGASFAMHPGGRQYGYYRFAEPRPGAPLALYAGRPGGLPFPAVQRSAAFALFLVAYTEGDTPEPAAR